MRKITKTCAHCGKAFAASCGVEKFCTNECMFMASVTAGPDCWIWSGMKDKDGYGTMKLKGRLAMRAHRFAVLMSGREIPAGMMVRHSCDNPSCVNPAHLTVGTALDNKRDSIDRGRHTRGERHYKAKLTPGQVREIRHGSEPAPQIARRLGVTKENVYAIRAGRIWKDVA